MAYSLLPPMRPLYFGDRVLICSDVDKTLLRHWFNPEDHNDCQSLQSISNAIKQLINNHDVFFYTVTGRSVPAYLKVLPEQAQRTIRLTGCVFSDGVKISNGAIGSETEVNWDKGWDSRIEKSGFDREKIQAVTESVAETYRNRHSGVIVETAGSQAYSCNYVISFPKARADLPMPGNADEIQDFLDLLTGLLEKEGFKREESYDLTAAPYHHGYCLRDGYNQYVVHVKPAIATKRNAVLFLVNAVKPDHVMVVGDEWNDVSMLSIPKAELEKMKPGINPFFALVDYKPNGSTVYTELAKAINGQNQGKRLPLSLPKTRLPFYDAERHLYVTDTGSAPQGFLEALQQFIRRNQLNPSEEKAFSCLA